MNKFELDSKKNWIKNIRRVKSPNFDDRPDNVDIRLVVIHGISLPPGKFGGNYIDQLFTNCLDPEKHPYFCEIQDLRVSAHLMINRVGLVTQYVPFTKRAWHAGESKFEGCSGCNDFSIGIELEGTDEDPYELVQYEKLSDIVNLIIKSWPDVTPARITGHCDISPERKTDPGPNFDWEYFYNFLD
jgi:N-acetyl-anhydromuramoyl-L-alanine amidase